MVRKGDSSLRSSVAGSPSSGGPSPAWSGSTPEERPASAEKITRPPNSFILFRADQVRAIKEQEPELRSRPQSELSKIVGERWKRASREIRGEYDRRAEDLRHEFLSKHGPRALSRGPRKSLNGTKRAGSTVGTEQSARRTDHSGSPGTSSLQPPSTSAGPAFPLPGPSFSNLSSFLGPRQGTPGTTAPPPQAAANRYHGSGSTYPVQLAASHTFASSYYPNIARAPRPNPPGWPPTYEQAPFDPNPSPQISSRGVSIRFAQDVDSMAPRPPTPPRGASSSSASATVWQPDSTAYAGHVLSLPHHLPNSYSPTPYDPFGSPSWQGADVPAQPTHRPELRRAASDSPALDLHSALTTSSGAHSSSLYALHLHDPHSRSPYGLRYGQARFTLPPSSTAGSQAPLPAAAPTPASDLFALPPSTIERYATSDDDVEKSWDPMGQWLPDPRDRA